MLYRVLANKACCLIKPRLQSLEHFQVKQTIYLKTTLSLVSPPEISLGLIAFGVFQIKNPKYHGWQYLFWIEGRQQTNIVVYALTPLSTGASTCVFAIFAYFWLPRSPSTWSFLTERQKAIARSRILADSSVTIDEKLDIRDAFRPLKEPLYWLWAIISLSLGVPLASVNNFLPQIVASLGYSTIKTNLYTVAPNIVGTVSLLVLTFSSDYFLERSIHICIPLATTLVGFIVLGSIDVVEHKGVSFIKWICKGTVDVVQVAYFACFLLTMGVRPLYLEKQVISSLPLGFGAIRVGCNMVQ